VDPQAKLETRKTRDDREKTTQKWILKRNWRLERPGRKNDPEVDPQAKFETRKTRDDREKTTQKWIPPSEI